MFFKVITIVCLAIASINAEANPGLLGAPLAYSAGYPAVAAAAPLAYSYPSALAYGAAYSAPLVAKHAALTAAPVAYAGPSFAAYSAGPAFTRTFAAAPGFPVVRSAGVLPALY